MKCGCNKDKDGIDTDVLFDLPQMMFDKISSKIGIKKGTKYNDDIKNMLKEDAKLNNKNLRDYLTENPDVSKQITIIEMKKQGGLLKYQVGGQIQNITNSGNDMNRLNQAKMYSDLQAPVTGMQKGGQVNDQKEFIQWLAQQLGVKTEEEFKAAVQQMGEQGLKQAQQMFQKQKGKQQGGVFKAKQGGILKYQKMGKFKAFDDREIVTTSDKKARYIPGTYDSESKLANTYGGITSNQQFDSGTQNAQAKIDYSKGVGQRTQAGLQGNRGTEGIDLTNRLAKEREELQKDPDIMNTPEFKNRLIKGKDGKTYVMDSKKLYNLGLYEERPGQIPPPKYKQEFGYVLGNHLKGTASSNSGQVFVERIRPDGSIYWGEDTSRTANARDGVRHKILEDNQIKAEGKDGSVETFLSKKQNYHPYDTLRVQENNGKYKIVGVNPYKQK